MSIIKINNGEKVYNKGKINEVHALVKVNLTVNRGDCIAVMGVSGSGKSTLLNIIGCMDLLTGGEYLFDGQNISAFNGMQLADFRNEKIGFVFQDYGLLLDDKVMDNIAIPLYFSKKYTSKQLDQRVMEIFERVGLKEELGPGGLKRKVGELSGGQRQRIAIARALVNEPDLILADEPTGALDSKTATNIVDELLGAAGKGVTVIMVTHDKAMADKFSYTVNIKDGILNN